MKPTGQNLDSQKALPETKGPTKQQQKALVQNQTAERALESSGISIVVVDREGLKPFQKGLQELEESIRYPVDDGADSFYIDHGSDYAEFFARMGKARFMVVRDGSKVIGSFVGVWREADFAGKKATGLYFCDLKLHKSYRGRGIVQRMLWYALSRLPIRRDFQGWRFIYFAAMQKDKGDVANSFKGWHLGKIMRPVSEQLLYFVPVQQLRQLASGGPQSPDKPGLDFSPSNMNQIEDTNGRKDLRLLSTGKPWPLVHIPKSPHRWDAPIGDYLRQCGESIHEQNPDALACFGLDNRLQSHIEWLQQQGIPHGARCCIHGFSVPFLAPGMRQYPWIHLAPSEI